MLSALTDDYADMSEDQVLLGEALTFDELMQACSQVESQMNRATIRDE